MLTSPNIVTPITLNIRWITAVRRAFVLVPTDAISDVIHVPILLPKIMYSPCSNDNSPATDIVTTIPLTADDDWISAVNKIPNNNSNAGFETFVRNALILSDFAKISMELVMTESPTNIIPSPVIMPPIFLTLSFLVSIIINAPTPAKAAKITVRLTFANPPAPSATISAVDVVPIFAPKTIDAACVRVISPLLTKPIAITVTAAELCTTAVVTVPMPTPISFLFDILANIRLISLPATISRLSPINFIP